MLPTVAPRSSSNEPSTKLPNEIVIKIWLGSQMQGRDVLILPVVSQVCKIWQRLSQDVDLRADVIIAKSTPVYAIFEAIVYPKVFTTELFESLRKKGAPVSVTLVQELYRWSLPPLITPPPEVLAARPKWGTMIGGDAYMAVAKEGSSLYGDPLNLQRDHDMWSFWMLGELQLTNEDLNNLFSKRRFAPLPLPFNAGPRVVTRVDLALRAFGVPERLKLARKNLAEQQKRVGGDPGFEHPAVTALVHRLPDYSGLSDEEREQMLRDLRARRWEDEIID